MKFSFQKQPVPPNTPATALNVGTWDGKPLILIGKELYACTPDITKLDGYSVSAALYVALKERFGWTHADAAEVLKTSARTAEGMPLGRVSVRSRLSLCHIAAGINS